VPLELTGLKASTRDGRIRQASLCARPCAAHMAPGPVVIRTSTSRLARDGRSDPGAVPHGQARQGFAARRRAPTGSFGTGSSRWRRNNGCGGESRSIPPTPRAGAPSTGSSTSGRSRPRRAAPRGGLVIGRRGLGHRARRREGDSTRAVHRDERAADSVVSGDRRPHTEPEDRSRWADRDRGQRPSWRTDPPGRATETFVVAAGRNQFCSVFRTVTSISRGTASRSQKEPAASCGVRRQARLRLGSSRTRHNM